MRDKQLYQQILGIESPWRVVDVELNASSEEVRVYIQRQKGSVYAVRNVEKPAQVMMSGSESGGIWIPASSRRF